MLGENEFVDWVLANRIVGDLPFQFEIKLQCTHFVKVRRNNVFPCLF